MTDPHLVIEREGDYVVLTLNRPEARNALSPQLLADLCAAFRELQSDETVRAVILTGAGTAFCAGLDLKAMGDSFDVDALLDQARTATSLVHRIRCYRYYICLCLLSFGCLPFPTS